MGNSSQALSLSLFFLFFCAVLFKYCPQQSSIISIISHHRPRQAWVPLFHQETESLAGSLGTLLQIFRPTQLLIRARTTLSLFPGLATQESQRCWHWPRRYWWPHLLYNITIFSHCVPRLSLQTSNYFLMMDFHNWWVVAMQKANTNSNLKKNVCVCVGWLYIFWTI